jgi:hypothetical protein
MQKMQQKPFQPFEIEFYEPQFYKVNCVKLVSYEAENALSVYTGVEMNTNDIFSVYEWRYTLEKNKIFEQKKLELCQAEVSSFFL